MSDSSDAEGGPARLLSSYFTPTPEERARIDAAPFRGTDAAGWKAFASAVHLQVIEAYQRGEVRLEDALRAVRSCSVKCEWQDRMTLLALTAREALEHPPAKRRKKVENPLWVRRSAANLVQMFRQGRPSEAFAPNNMNGETTPILEEAIAWLRALDLCDSVTPRTLYEWYKAAKKAGALEGAEPAVSTGP